MAGDPNTIIQQAPAWSPQGLRAGSGLSRYTNYRPGGAATAAQPAAMPMQYGYQAPAVMSIADRIAQYQRQQQTPAAAAAPSYSQEVGLGDGAAGFDGGQSIDSQSIGAVGSGQSLGSQIAAELGISNPSQGAMQGLAVGGFPGAAIGGLLGAAQEADPTNPASVNAMNGYDVGVDMGLEDAGINDQNGYDVGFDVGGGYQSGGGEGGGGGK